LDYLVPGRTEKTSCIIYLAGRFYSMLQFLSDRMKNGHDLTHTCCDVVLNSHAGSFRLSERRHKLPRLGAIRVGKAFDLAGWIIRYGAVQLCFAHGPLSGPRAPAKYGLTRPEYTPVNRIWNCFFRQAMIVPNGGTSSARQVPPLAGKNALVAD
jgi:hypothetical protein